MLFPPKTRWFFHQAHARRARLAPMSSTISAETRPPREAAAIIPRQSYK
jgi:hypothetical protein